MTTGSEQKELDYTPLMEAVSEHVTNTQILLWEHWEDFMEKDDQEKWDILMRGCDFLTNALGEEMIRRES